MATSYNGWIASRYPALIGINTNWEPIKGHRFPGGIKSGDVETVMTYFVRQLDARVEPIEEYRPGDEWGYYYKTSANSYGTLSNHSSGTAFDYNATQHPNGVRGTWTKAQVAEIRKIQQECSGVVHWLYDATRVPDEMHFEIRASSAQVHTAANKIKAMGGNPPQPEPPEPKPEEASLVYRIVWFRGEPTAEGDQEPNPTAAYRCTYAKREKVTSGDPYMCVEGWWIKDLAELTVWRERGLLEINKASDPAALRSSIALHNGPFDNTN